MARIRHWIGLAALSLSLAGCVPQEKYAALKLDDDQLRAQLGQSQTETENAKAQAAAYQQQLAALNGNGNTNAALIDNLNKQNQNLQAQYDEINRKYADAIAAAGKMGGTALPAPLSNELSSFAAANPDLVEFDAARGMVKFKSDVTFEVGDATVNSRAKEVISRFASILNSSGANGYELLVAGHTDSTPVANPETIRKGHKNNWYLSAHRAIAVVAELAGDGVNSRRLGAVGYAEQRPIASNGSESGKAANRRVEVLILPSSVHSAPVAEYSAPTRQRTRPAPAPAPSLNKDSATIDTRGVNMNK